MCSNMDSLTGYWRFAKMNRGTKCFASNWCASLEGFTITNFDSLIGSPLVFEFVNGAWQARFYHVDVPWLQNIYYYNDQEVQHQDNIIIKDGDSLRVIYLCGSISADVTMFYKEDTIYWSLEKAIKIKEDEFKAKVASLQRQNQELRKKLLKTAVRLGSANKSIDQCKELEGKLRKQIADLQLHQQMQEERGQLAKSMEKLQEVPDELESANKANLELIRKYKQVETELREKIANLEGALQVQQDVKERGKNQQLPKSDPTDVIPQPSPEENALQLQPSLQFPAKLEQKTLQCMQMIQEIASISELERSQLNNKIAKLAQQLEDKQDRKLLRTQPAMAAVEMLNQVLKQDQSECQVLEGNEDTDEVKEAKSSIVSESDISVDKINCVICKAELGEDSVLDGLHRYCHQCAKN